MKSQQHRRVFLSPNIYLFGWGSTLKPEIGWISLLSSAGLVHGPGSQMRFRAVGFTWLEWVSSNYTSHPLCESSHLAGAYSCRLVFAVSWARWLRWQFSFLYVPYPHLICSAAQSCPTLTPWTAAPSASLPFTNSQSLLKLMSIEVVMSCKCKCIKL